MIRLSNFIELTHYWGKNDQFSWNFLNEPTKNKYPDKTKYASKQEAIEHAVSFLKRKYSDEVKIDSENIGEKDCRLKSRKPEEQGMKERRIIKGEYPT